MPEQITPDQINAATRQNKYLAERIAYAEEPWRAGSERAREMGETVTELVMSDHRLEAARDVYADPASHVPRPVAPMDRDRKQAASAHEKLMTPEHLEQILKGSIYVANPYVWGRERVVYNGLNGNMRLPLLENMKLDRHARNTEKDFLDAGVSEVVTVGELSGVDLRRQKVPALPWPAGQYAGEPSYAVQYMTLTTQATERVADPNAPGGTSRVQKYEYVENRYAALNNLTDAELAAHPIPVINNRKDLEEVSRRGRLCDFSYTVLLPKTEAEELGAAMMTNPQLARDIGDDLVQNKRGQIQTGSHIVTSWKDWKPPYQKWNEVNGGVDRMAFRTNSDQSAAQSTIVEYNNTRLPG